MYYGERCTFVYIVKNIDFKDVEIAKLKLDKIYQYMYINFLPRQVALGKISNMNYENLHQDLWIGICHIMSSWAVIRISAKIAEIEPVRLTINWQRLTLAAPIRRKNFFFLSSSPKSTPSQLLAEWTYDNINKHLILAFGYMFVLANWNIFQVIQLKKIQ